MIKDTTEYEQAKQMLQEFYSGKNNSPEESDKFFDLMDEIVKYEIENDLI